MCSTMRNAVITDQPQIFGLLGRLREQRTLLHLRHPDQTRADLSILLDVSMDSDQLFFDAPRQPTVGEYRSGDSIIVQSNLDGVDTRFEVRVQRMKIDHEGYKTLVTSWPEHVVYRQRRNAFRVSLAGKKIRLGLSPDEETMLSGQLVDISVGGFGALINRTAELQEGETVDCCLEIPDHVMSVEAEVRQLTRAPQTRYQRLSARFVNLDPALRRRLERIVAELERRAIRTDRTR